MAGWRQIPYAPGEPVWEAPVRFERTPPESFALSLERLAFFDAAKIKQDNLRMYELVKSGILENEPTIGALSKALGAIIVEHKVTPAFYAEQFGVQRLRYEEINHCRDHIFFKYAGNSIGHNWDLIEQALVHVKPESVLFEFIATLRKSANSMNLVASVVIEYSAQVGGVLDEVRGHLASGHPHLAQCAFLDFLLLAGVKEKMADSSKISTMDLSYCRMGGLVTHALRSLGLENSATVIEALNSGPEHPGVVAERILQGVLTTFLYSQEERLDFIIQAQRKRSEQLHKQAD